MRTAWPVKNRSLTHLPDQAKLSFMCLLCLIHRPAFNLIPPRLSINRSGPRAGKWCLRKLTSALRAGLIKSSRSNSTTWPSNERFPSQHCSTKRLWHYCTNKSANLIPGNRRQNKQCLRTRTRLRIRVRNTTVCRGNNVTATPSKDHAILYTPYYPYGTYAKGLTILSPNAGQSRAFVLLRGRARSRMPPVSISRPACSPSWPGQP